MKLLEELKKIQLTANNLVTDPLKEQEKPLTSIVNLCSELKCEVDKLTKVTAITQDAINSELTDCRSMSETNEHHQRVRPSKHVCIYLCL